MNLHSLTHQNTTMSGRAMSTENPRLENHVPFWKFDLPSPNTPVTTNINPKILRTTPNHISEIFLEFPTTTLGIRGLSIFGGIVITVINLVVLALVIDTMLSASIEPYLFPITLCFAIFIFSLWMVMPAIRMDFELPQNQPLRFNRLRRKVYAYHFHYSWLYPFSKTKWGVRTTAYNWDDLHAEASSVYGPMGTGGLKESISLCALKPGTHEVIDRFHLIDDIFLGEQYWAMICLYMQQGPEALPTLIYEPRDWDTDPVCRWAPKVQWPADMDLESRTAPTPGDAP